MEVSGSTRIGEPRACNRARWKRHACENAPWVMQDGINETRSCGTTLCVSREYSHVERALDRSSHFLRYWSPILLLLPLPLSFFRANFFDFETWAILRPQDSLSNLQFYYMWKINILVEFHLTNSYTLFAVDLNFIYNSYPTLFTWNVKYTSQP